MTYLGNAQANITLINQ